MKNDILKPNNPTISIIIPVYQVAPYLRDCLDSVLTQSFTDWEMLLVDDGSTDGSEIICDEYGEKDSRIRVFHQDNQGLSSTRNVGLLNARGEYITLIDSDDILLSNDYLCILYEGIIKHHAEISMCKRISFQDNSSIPEPNLNSDTYEILSGRDVFTKPPYCFNIKDFSMAVFKLYHRSCFKDILYPVGRIMEDLSVAHHIFYPRSKIVVLDKYMYGRRYRIDSITSASRGSLQYRDIMLAMDDCIAYLKDKEDAEAVTYAQKRKEAFMVYYYFASLKDGSIDEIPSSIEISSFEKNLNYIQLLRYLRNADPDYKRVQSKEYLTQLSNRAFQLLHTTLNYLLNGENSNIYDHELAINEHILPITDSYYIQSTRQFILFQNEWKKITNSLNELKESITPIPLIPTDLLRLYTRPWLRYTDSYSFLIHKDDLETIKQVMEEHGYTSIPNDPLERDRLSSITFKKDTLKFTFLFSIPFYITGIHKHYLTILFQQLLKEKREMNLMEYMVLLITKLHPSMMYSSSACLSDLLDLTLILHSTPTLSNEEYVQKKIKEYRIEETWNIIYSICTKVPQTLDNSFTLPQDELTYLQELISKPFLRSSYLQKYSSSLMEQNRLLDPIEYTILKEKHLAYLVNSKAACSSIKASMLNEDVSDYTSIHHIAYHRGLSKNELDDDSYFTFTFVRNPFARLVSCYESKYHVDRKKNLFHFRDYLDGYLYYDEGFDTFVKKICALPYRLMDRHFRLQYNLVFTLEDKCRCDYIGKFESLEDGFKPIQEKNHLSPLPHLNRTGTDDWMNYYTIETATLVYNTFKKDILEFGYENTYINLLSYLNN